MTIRVATWNIRKCIGTDRRRDPARVARQLAELDADVVALQEADRRFGARQAAIPPAMIEALTPYRPVALHIRPGGLGWHGNALLVRHGVVVQTARPIALPALEPRGAVMADLVVGGQPLRVVGMHLDLSGLARRRQLRAILRAIDAEPPRPMVLMGDMNQWSDRGALSELAFHPLRVLDTPLSYHSQRPVARLDRIIVSHEWRAANVSVWRNGRGPAATDHLPVHADLSVMPSLPVSQAAPHR